MFVRSSVSSFLSSLILRPAQSISRHILSCFWLLPTLTTVLLPDVSLQTSSFQFFHVLFAVCSPFVDCGDSGIETRKEKWNRMKRKKKVNCLKCFDRTLNYQSLLFPKSRKKNATLLMKGTPSWLRYYLRHLALFVLNSTRFFWLTDFVYPRIISMQAESHRKNLWLLPFTKCYYS